MVIANEIETQQVWYGCYDGGWQGLISEQAFSHPAKFSRNLISRIYTYALERGWLKVGDTVLDPFGGVGLGALDAGANGLNYIGVELETRFHDMGQGCDCTGISKADWVRYFGRWDKVAHKDGRHWCPQCLAEAKQVTLANGQLSFFEPEPSAAYTRNSGVIPETKPHHYTGNLELFRKYAQPGTWAVLLNGDSRNLRAVIGQAVADGLLSSPPYANSLERSNGIDASKIKRPGGRNSQSVTDPRYGSTTGQLGGMSEGSLADSLVSSPPYLNGEKGHPSLGSVNKDNWGKDGRDIAGRRGLDGNYGTTTGQLGEMSEGSLADSLVSSPPFSPPGNNPTGQGQGVRADYRNGKRKATTPETTYGATPGQLGAMGLEGFDAALSSPPFAGNTGGRGEASRNGIDPGLFDRHSGGMKKGTGDNPANLDHLSMRGFGEALVSSPPFEQGSEGVMRANKFKNPAAFAKAQMNKGHGCSFDAKMRAMVADNDRAHYGQTEGQLGTEQGTTFWAAARLIVSESYLALKPGSFTFWVVKAFIRDKKRVDFPAQWRQLCEACGFEFVESIYAMQISQAQYQQELNGDAKKIQKATKSFFRRTYEKKFPDNRIDWEEVLILRKPL